MEYKEGQELISGHLSRGRHYKVLSVKPVYLIGRSGKKKLSQVLITLENQTIKKEEYKNMSEFSFNKLKIFEISQSELDKLVSMQVLKLKE